MKRMMLSAMFAVTAFVGAPISSAGVVVNVTPVVTGSGFGAPDSALTGFSSFAVTLSTTQGELISAIDASFTGPMHQRWADGDFSGTADPSPQGPLAGNNRGDSSLTPLTGALIGSAPIENNNVSQSPLSDTFVPFVGGFDYGIGSFLSGAWGIPGSSQSTSANVAYLVIPDTGSVAYDLAVATSNGTFDLVGTIAIPEPASIALLATGGLLMLRRRVA